MGDTQSGGTSKNRPKLHALNGIRVLAEFAVVRLHSLHDHRIERISTGDEELQSHMRGPYGMDIMCFFFVLSGFVMMYTHQDADFSHWKSKLWFKSRLIRDFISQWTRRTQWTSQTPCGSPIPRIVHQEGTGCPWTPVGVLP